MSRADRIRDEADQRVSAWPRLDLKALPDPGTWSKCQSGGFLVNVGEPFPVWRCDIESVRRLLLARDLVEAELAKP